MGNIKGGVARRCVFLRCVFLLMISLLNTPHILRDFVLIWMGFFCYRMLQACKDVSFPLPLLSSHVDTYMYLLT